MREILVELPPSGDRSYRIVVGREHPVGMADDLVETASPSRWAVLSDDEVGPRYAEPLARRLGDGANVYSFPAGEASKRRGTVAELQDRMVEDGFGRDGWVVAVGGGVVGDVAGFVAATLFRGVPYVQVPTSLLAMVDSAVGGKTGVDTPRGKNLVGSIHQPRRVLVDVATLDTLPDEELVAGLAEVIKYGAILDADLFARLEADLLSDCIARRQAGLEEVVARCCRLKAEVVQADEREADYRQILNFGHTVGHAIESVAGYEIRHGEAVAIGMVAEWRLAVELVGAPSAAGDRLERLCRAAGLPTALPDGVTPESVTEAARYDKKVRRGEIRCALPRRLGEMARGDRGYGHPVSPERLRRLLA